MPLEDVIYDIHKKHLVLPGESRRNGMAGYYVGRSVSDTGKPVEIEAKEEYEMTVKALEYLTEVRDTMKQRYPLSEHEVSQLLIRVENSIKEFVEFSKFMEGRAKRIRNDVEILSTYGVPDDVVQKMVRDGIADINYGLIARVTNALKEETK